MESALKLNSPDGLRCITISTAIGLLWTTGMRPNELCKLTDSDIDLDKGLVSIRETKFAKNRVLPIHKSTIFKLKSYLLLRNKLRIDFLDSHFFLMTNSRQLHLRNFEYAFQLIRKSLLPSLKLWKRRPPRLYDIRHSFASTTLLNWLKNGIDVNNKILYLSTYLGHVKVADTYWYLTGTQELLHFVTENFEKYFYDVGGDFDEE
jgi:integrase